MWLPRRFWSSDYGLSVLLILLVVLIFVIHPLREIGVGGRLLIGLVYSLILLAGVAAVAQNALITVMVGGIVFVNLVVRWARFFSSDRVLDESNLLFSALSSIVLAIVVLAQVFRKGPITFHRIQGAVAVYLLIGLTWAFLYRCFDLHEPGSFSIAPGGSANPDTDNLGRFVYFSFITLTTVGYGDITALHPLARTLVMVEALVGQLFPAILLAKLVSMQVSRGRD